MNSDRILKILLLAFHCGPACLGTLSEAMTEGSDSFPGFDE